MRIAALASGTGTILQAIITAGIELEVVLVDRPCAAEAVARAAGVSLEPLYREDFSPGFDRDGYSRRVAQALVARDVGLVAMAGFGTVLSAPLIDAFPGRVLNTHPALLPAFKGWHAVADALAAGVAVTGCTVHVATAELDEGPILAQETVAVEDGDTVEVLHERIKAVERRLYPATIAGLAARLCEGREDATAPSPRTVQGGRS